MNQANQVQHAADLVPLEVADHVPPKTVRQVDGFGAPDLPVPLEKLFDLGGPVHQRLDTILGKIHVTQFDQLAHLVDGRVLGYHRQQHGVRWSIDAPGGLGNPRSHRLVALPEGRLPGPG